MDIAGDIYPQYNLDSSTHSVPGSSYLPDLDLSEYIAEIPPLIDPDKGYPGITGITNESRLSDLILHSSNRTKMDCSIPKYKRDNVWTPDVIQRVVILAVIMTLTLLGNTVIIIVLTCSKYRRLNSRVNIFIINLAIGDLSVCFVTMTTEILFVVFGEWILGPAACKVLLYGQIITLASTTFILTAMSFDRYLAICKPLSFGVSRVSRAKKMIVTAWFLAFVFAVPQLFIFKQVLVEDDNTKCEIFKCRSLGYTAFWQRKLYFTFMTFYILIIPASLISFCYINVAKVVWNQGREVTTSKFDKSSTLRRSYADKKAIPRAKIKTVKMTLSIIVSFISCWTPYFVAHLIHIWSDYSYKIPKNVMVWVETCAVLNSAVNPILYGFFNIKLKRGLVEVFCPGKLRPEPHTRLSLSIRSGITDCTSVPVDGDNNCLSTKRIANKCRQSSANSSSSASSSNYRHSVDSDSKCLFTFNASGKALPINGSAGKNHVITEENTNGFRYRVKFTKTKESSDRESQEGCDKLLSDEKTKEEVLDCVTSI
ncbi:unnamed protein product [Owenia fusiformis]|uniref:Uncharacterized protein n=1 Tax=Owenia fusiformis TaxID=6347 RepID=A0A8J1UZS0_OWEFU|nr:unnamed protein product [Owenia fusiformis]